MKAPIYNDDGQLVTGTLNDYAVPRASMVPAYEWTRPVRQVLSIRWASKAPARPAR